MKTVEQIMDDLKSMANPEYIKKMEYFGINGAKALGIKNMQLKPYAKTLTKDQKLASSLWDQDIHEAKHLAILLMQPQKIEERDAEKMISELYSWDVCDGLGMKIFPKTSFGYDKVFEWSKRSPEFEKRCSFSTMVGITLDRKVPEEKILSFFPVIESEACDDRNFVKKAVNWALRQAGKRSLSLNQQAIECAERIKKQNTSSAKWIASDALRELQSEKIMERLKKKKR